MKKVILTIAISQILLLGVFAQKNTLLISGNFGVDNTNTKQEQIYFSPGPIPYPNPVVETKSTNFIFNTSVGFQFSDNWTLGINANIFNSKEVGKQIFNAPNYYEQTSKQKYIGIGPMVRYTKKISNLFYFYTQLNTNFGTNTNTTVSTYFPVSINPPSSPVITKSNISEINLFPALFINIKNNFGLNINFGGINYKSSKQKDLDVYSKQFNFTFGKTFEIGISKNFNVSKTKKK